MRDAAAAGFALDALPEDQLAAELGHCCGARRFVRELAARRPFGDLDGLLAAAAEVEAELEPEDWLEAFGHHPPIGGAAALRARFASAVSKDWSRGEQSQVAAADEQVLERLAAGNEEYLRRFGYIFIVFATGKSAAEMLAILESRLGNDPRRELEVAAAEQSKITRLRLHKLLARLDPPIESTLPESTFPETISTSTKATP